MAYFAKKVCMFSGHNFLKGEVIPEELVLKSKVPELIKTGVIEVVESAKADGTICIPVKAEEGILELYLSEEDIVKVFDVLHGGADEAKAIIDDMTSNDALILIDITDNRKGIKDYVKKRAKAILKSDEESVDTDETADNSAENENQDETSDNSAENEETDETADVKK